MSLERPAVPPERFPSPSAARTEQERLCTWRDQYHIHDGSRMLSLRLAEACIRHRCKEFDDDHSDNVYRMDVSLPFLYRIPMR